MTWGAPTWESASEYGWMDGCKRRKLKVNAGKSKMMVCERREEVIDFIIAYRVRMPAVVRCRIMLGSEKMEEVSEFKYLGTVLSQQGGMEGEIGE